MFQDIFELQCGSIKSGQHILIIDDLLATGGTISAAEKLIKQAGGIVDLALVIIELTALKGREKTNCEVHSFIQYDD